MTTRVRAGGISNDAIHNKHLSDDSVDSDVVSNNILSKVNVAGTSINDPGEFRLGKVVREYSATDITLSTTSLVDMFTGSNTSGFTGGSHLELQWYIPSRKDTSSGTAGNWMGMYFQPCLSFDDGTTWYSLGTCGYDGGTMTRYASSIHNYTNHAWIQNSGTNIPSSGSYTVKIKFMGCEYETTGDGKVNVSHDINGKNSGSYIDTSAGIDRYQHYSHWTLKEWIPV